MKDTIKFTLLAAFATTILFAGCGGMMGQEGYMAEQYGRTPTSTYVAPPNNCYYETFGRIVCYRYNHNFQYQDYYDYDKNHYRYEEQYRHDVQYYHEEKPQKYDNDRPQYHQQLPFVKQTTQTPVVKPQQDQQQGASKPASLLPSLQPASIVTIQHPTKLLSCKEGIKDANGDEGCKKEKR